MLIFQTNHCYSISIAISFLTLNNSATTATKATSKKSIRERKSKNENTFCECVLNELGQ